MIVHDPNICLGLLHSFVYTYITLCITLYIPHVTTEITLTYTHTYTGLKSQARYYALNILEELDERNEVATEMWQNCKRM